MDPEWRCISYQKWWYSSQLCDRLPEGKFLAFLHRYARELVLGRCSQTIVDGDLWCMCECLGFVSTLPLAGLENVGIGMWMTHPGGRAFYPLDAGDNDDVIWYATTMGPWWWCWLVMLMTFLMMKKIILDEHDPWWWEITTTESITFIWCTGWLNKNIWSDVFT